MELEILYFAGLREALGREQERVEVPGTVTDVEALRQWLITRGREWEDALDSPRGVLSAVNEEMVSAQTRLSPGDRVAFFPPVTGG